MTPQIPHNGAEESWPSLHELLELHLTRAGAGPPLASPSTARPAAQGAAQPIGESLRRYRLLLEQTREIILCLTSDGQIAEASEAAALAYGYTRADLCRMNIRQLCARSCAGAPTDERHHGTTTGLIFTCQHRRRDGSIFPVEVKSADARVPGQSVVVSLIRDISDKVRRDQLWELVGEVHQMILMREPHEQILMHISHGLQTVIGCESAHMAFVVTDQPPEAVALAKVDLQGNAAGTGWLVLCCDRPGSLGSGELFDLRVFTEQIASWMEAAQAREQVRLQQVALEATASGVLITDREGVILWANPACERLTGYAPAELIGRKPPFLKPDVHPNSFYQELWDSITQGLSWRGEMQNRRKDGTLYVEELNITPVRRDQGEITHFIAIKQDVTGRKQQDDQLRFMAAHDPVTGLPNRRGLESALDAAVARARRGAPAGLLLLDLDRFKLINDGMGSAVGDQVLAEFARALALEIGSGDLLARLGDDEFGVLLHGVETEELERTAERLRRFAEALELPSDVLVRLTVSIGAAAISGEHGSDEVMAQASAALSVAKEDGRNRTVCFSRQPGLQVAGERAQWAARIRDALHTNRFQLCFQPVIHLASGQAEHVEALLRLRDADGTVHLPADFLGAAETCNLMPQVDRWVVRAVVRLLRKHPDLRIFANLSGQSLGSADLLAEIEGWILTAGPQLASRLTFEVTESAAVRDLLGARKWMQRLSRLGSSFALDDFGMGFSSFNYLRALPVRYVKLDGSFVRSMAVDAQSRAIVRSITSLAHTLGKRVVAEWVETEEIGRLLTAMGVEYGQGYALGRPSPTWPPLRPAMMIPGSDQPDDGGTSDGGDDQVRSAGEAGSGCEH